MKNKTLLELLKAFELGKLSYEKAIDKRLQRIFKLKAMIKAKKPSESVEKILAQFCIQTGVSEQTCIRYYNLLITAEEIKGKRIIRTTKTDQKIQSLIEYGKRMKPKITKELEKLYEKEKATKNRRIDLGISKEYSTELFEMFKADFPYMLGFKLETELMKYAEKQWSLQERTLKKYVESAMLQLGFERVNVPSKLGNKTFHWKNV